MSEPLKSVHVRLSDELHKSLRLMAEHDQTEIAALCERIIAEAVQGKFHALKVAAQRIARLGISAADRDSAGL